MFAMNCLRSVACAQTLLLNAECSLHHVIRLTSDQLRRTRRNRPGAARAVRRSEWERPERTLCIELQSSESEACVTNLGPPGVHPAT